jgi:hypothetical protein
MSSTTTDPFTELASLADQPQQMIDVLVKIYRRQQMPHELFEALKMRTRLRLGLPVLADEGGPARPDDIERQLENGLLDACREVGAMLLRSGRIREGWVYFRPTGDNRAAAELIRGLEVTDENADEIIQVCLNEGVDVEYGYGLLLSRNGTCNSITSFDQALANRHYRDQRAAAKLLLDHVYGELVAALRFDIQRREGSEPSESTVEGLMRNRKDLLEGGAYHLDTTHLAATIRIARVLESKEDIARLLELVEYGRKLNSQYQYPGDEPFAEFYPAYGLFYGALMGRGVDQAISYFQRKARSLDVHQHGTAPVEVYVDLLDRLGRHGEALSAAVEMIPADVPATRVAPLLLELSEKAKDPEPLKAFARRRGDMLIYAAALASTPAK